MSSASSLATWRWVLIMGSAASARALSAAAVLMSARANPYHNAWTESFMGTLKTEMLQDGSFIDDGDARTEIFEYIEPYVPTVYERPSFFPQLMKRLGKSAKGFIPRSS